MIFSVLERFLKPDFKENGKENKVQAQFNAAPSHRALEVTCANDKPHERPLSYDTIDSIDSGLDLCICLWRRFEVLRHFQGQFFLKT